MGICEKCRKKSMYLELTSDMCIPTMVDMKRMYEAITYFLYCVPNISSLHSKRLSKEMQENLFKELEKYKPMNFVFCDQIDSSVLHDNALSASSICMKCHRAVLQKQIKETKYQCLVRHLRNALAHGCFYTFHMGNDIGIYLEDKKGSKITARIAINRVMFVRWYTQIYAFERKMLQQD